MRQLLQTQKMSKVGLLALLTFIAYHSALLTTQAQTITGMIFFDGNRDGTKNTTEVGYAGVTVKAYAASATAVATATSSFTGTIGSYTLSGLTAGTNYRIEFTLNGLPVNEGVSGTQSKSSVQFVTAGATSVDYGVYFASEMATERNPRLIAGCGLVWLGAGPSTTSVASWRYLTRAATIAATTADPPHQDDILASQVGIPYAMDMRKEGNNQYAIMTPVASKLTGIFPTAPNGDDAIYIANYSNASTGYAFQSYKLLVDLGSLASPISLAAQNPVTTAAAAQFGEFGLGGVAVTDDGKTLYVINMGSGKLIKMDISGVVYASLPATAPTSATEIAITGANCTTGIFRPNSLKIYNGELYVGGVCDGSTGGTNAGLRVKILKMNLATNTFSEVFAFDPTLFTAGTLSTTAAWSQVRWKSTFTGTYITAGELQPVLADFAFDDNGALIIGVTNRKVYSQNSDQEMGYLIRTWRNADGSFTLENTGVSGPLTTTAREGGASVLNTPGNKTQDVGGPSGTWFYEQGILAFNEYHPYLFNGGVFVLPGSGEVVAGFTDPYWAQQIGARYFDVKNGRATYAMSLAGIKAFSITATRAIGAENPFEIGNRVWKDTNNDGIQDPTEPSLVGVTVTICAKGSSTAIGTAVTDANGNYYFSTETGTSTASKILGLALLPNTEYDIKITALGADASVTGLTLTGVSPLTPGEAAATNTGTTIANNDAKVVSGKPTIAMKTGNAGENNHSYDFGFGGGSCNSTYPDPCATTVLNPYKLAAPGQFCPGVTGWTQDRHNFSINNIPGSGGYILKPGTQPYMVENTDGTVRLVIEVVYSNQEPYSATPPASSYDANKGFIIELTGSNKTTGSPSAGSPATIACSGTVTTSWTFYNTFSMKMCGTGTNAGVYKVIDKIADSNTHPFQIGNGANQWSTDLGGGLWFDNGDVSGDLQFNYSAHICCTPITAATATATPSSLATGSSSTLNVTGTGITAGTTTFSWAGTGGFTATTQNPSTGALATAGGYSYTVTVSNGGTCTATATTSLTVTTGTVSCTSVGVDKVFNVKSSTNCTNLNVPSGAWYGDINDMPVLSTATTNKFVEYSNGTATLDYYVNLPSNVANGFHVTATFSGKSSTTAKTPYTQPCGGTQQPDWHFYPTGLVTIEGFGCYAGHKATLNVANAPSRTPHDVQVGTNASAIATGYGMGIWGSTDDVSSATSLGTCTAVPSYGWFDVVVLLEDACTPCTPIIALSANKSPASIAIGSSSTLSSSSTSGITAGTTTFSWAGTGGFSATTQNPSTGALATAGGYSYTVTVTNANGTGICTATATTSLTVSTTVVACINPTFTGAAVQVTCTGATANTDGKLTITAITNSDKVAYSTGATYTGTATYSTATLISALSPTGQVVGNLANPAANQQYTIRVYNGSNTCYTDQTVTLINKNCTTPCGTPRCGTITITVNN